MLRRQTMSKRFRTGYQLKTTKTLGCHNSIQKITPRKEECPLQNFKSRRKQLENLPTPRVPTKIPTILASLALSTR